MVDLLGLAEIAKTLGLESTTVRRFIARHAEDLGIEMRRGKGLKLLLSKADADRVIARYQAEKMPMVGGSSNDPSKLKYGGFGFFYIIQLIPEFDPHRVKIGFTDSLEQRLAEHQTSAPTARIIKSWPCKRSWDYAAMDSITREGCKLVLNEVFEGDIQGFIARGDAFFAMMPPPDSERELSEYSPLYEPDEKTESESDHPCILEQSFSDAFAAKRATGDLQLLGETQ